MSLLCVSEDGEDVARSVVRSSKATSAQKEDRLHGHALQSWELLAYSLIRPKYEGAWATAASTLPNVQYMYLIAPVAAGSLAFSALRCQGSGSSQRACSCWEGSF